MNISAPILISIRRARKLFTRDGIVGETARPLLASADEVNVSRQTFACNTFAQSTHQLPAEVDHSADDQVRPVISFIHGGALMMGGRGQSTKPVSRSDGSDKAG